MNFLSKNGNLLTTVDESQACNVLNGTHYTEGNPCELTGSATDIYVAIDNCAQVTPGETYYLIASTDAEWSPRHGLATDKSNLGQATIWLYMSKTYNPSSYNYNSPVNFNSTSTTKIKDGVWKYTVPDGYNMARIRLNIYANGTDSITVKFWNIALIPEDKYIDEDITSMKVSKEDSIAVEAIIEI